jgi:hypothetical protein
MLTRSPSRLESCDRSQTGLKRPWRTNLCFDRALIESSSLIQTCRGSQLAAFYLARAHIEGSLRNHKDYEHRQRTAEPPKQTRAKNDGTVHGNEAAIRSARSQEQARPFVFTIADVIPENENRWLPSQCHPRQSKRVAATALLTRAPHTSLHRALQKNRRRRSSVRTKIRRSVKQKTGSGRSGTRWPGLSAAFTRFLGYLLPRELRQKAVENNVGLTPGHTEDDEHPNDNGLCPLDRENCQHVPLKEQNTWTCIEVGKDQYQCRCPFGHQAIVPCRDDTSPERTAQSGTPS